MKKSLLAILLILSIGCSENSEKSGFQFKVNMTEDEVKNLTEEKITYLFALYNEKGLEEKFFEDYKKNPFSFQYKVENLFQKGQAKKALDMVNSSAESDPLAARLKYILYSDIKSKSFHEKDSYLAYSYLKKSENLGGFPGLKSIIAAFQLQNHFLFLNNEENVKKRLKVIEKEAEKGVLQSLKILAFYRSRGFVPIQLSGGMPSKMEYKDDQKLIDICFEILKKNISPYPLCIAQLGLLREGSYKESINKKLKETEAFLNKEIQKNSIFSVGYEMQLASFAPLKAKEDLSGDHKVRFVIEYQVAKFLNIFKKYQHSSAFLYAYQGLDPLGPNVDAIIGDYKEKGVIGEYRDKMKAEVTKLFKTFEKQVEKIGTKRTAYKDYQAKLFQIYESNYLNLENKKEKLMHHSYEWFKAEVLSEKKLASIPPKGYPIGIRPSASISAMMSSSVLSEKQKVDLYNKMYDFLKDQITKVKDPYMLSQLVFNETEMIDLQIENYDILKPVETKEQLDKKLVEVYKKSYFEHPGAESYINLRSDTKEDMVDAHMEHLKKKIESATEPYLKGKALFTLAVYRVGHYFASEEAVDLEKEVYKAFRDSYKYGYVMGFSKLSHLLQGFQEILMSEDILKPKGKDFPKVMETMHAILKEMHDKNKELGIEAFL